LWQDNRKRLPHSSNAGIRIGAPPQGDTGKRRADTTTGPDPDCVGPRKPRRIPLAWSQWPLRQQWEAGEHTGALFWEELTAQGSSGSSRTFEN